MLLRNIKIKQRLFVTLLMIAIVPVLILGVIASSQSRSNIRSLVGTYSGQLAVQLGTTLQNEMEILSSRATDITFSPLVQDNVRKYEKLDKAEQAKTLNEMKDRFQNSFVNEKRVKAFSIYNESITFDYTNLLTAGIDVGTDDIKGYVKEIAATANGAFTWFVDKKGNIFLCYSVKSKQNNKAFATALMVIDKSYLSELLSGVNLGNEAEILLISNDNITISSNDTDNIKPGNPYEYQNLILRLQENEAKKEQDEAYTNSVMESIRLKEDMYVSYSKIADTDWFIIAAIPNKALDVSSATIRSSIFVTGAICAVIAFMVAIFMSRSITIPLGHIVSIMKKAESGHLIPAKEDMGKDEISELTACFNNMIKAIKALIQNVHQSASMVAEKTVTIASSAEQALMMSENMSRALDEVASGACSQAEDSVVSSDKMCQLSEAINTVTKDLNNTEEVITKTFDLSRKASRIVSMLNANSSEVNEASAAIISDIKSLSEDMTKIQAIVKVIGSIAEQTNMLALNASIEAARAGNAGLGFAVVAEEVKKLAEQSKESSKNISSIIDRISKKTIGAVKTANIASESIIRQMSAVSDTDKAFQTISESMDELSARMSEMRNEVQRMISIRQDTVAAIENISAVSQETAARSEEASSHTSEQMQSSKGLADLAKELSLIAEGLEKSIVQFKF